MDRKILTENPFASIDEAGVGKLMAMAVKEGRATRPGLEVGICGEHGGDPTVHLVLPQDRAELRLLLALPDPDRPAGRGPGGAR